MKNDPLAVVPAVAMTAVASVAGIIVIGRALDTDAARKLERTVPVLGPILGGVRAAWRQVYNP